MKFLPLILIPFLTAPVQAYESIGDRSNRQAYQSHTPQETQIPWWRRQYQPGYSSSSTCTRREYREEYVPGTAHSPGYVRTWNDEVEVPCYYRRPRPSTPPRQRIPSPDGNECSEGAILGGILGGGAGAALSQGDGRWWAIPLGVVAGSVVGCDIDGG